VLAGDFSVAMSPACRATGVEPSRLPASPATASIRRGSTVAVNSRACIRLSGQDQCGLVSARPRARQQSDEHQVAKRAKMTLSQSLFVRVFNTRLTLTATPENPLFPPSTGQRNNVFSTVLGHTLLSARRRSAIPRDIQQERAGHRRAAVFQLAHAGHQQH
jgi:hypothetical protein